MKQRLALFLLSLVLLWAVAQDRAVAQAEAPSSSDRLAQTTPAVSSQPSIIPLKGTDQIQLQLVNCNWVLDCAIASLLLPNSNRIDRLQLQFDNPAPVPAQILNAATVIQGDTTRYQLANAFSISQGPLTLAADEIVSLPLTLNRAAMPPDRYTGTVYLRLANQPNRLVLPVTLDVRIGPLLPLLVLFIGIALGRLFKYMQEKGGPQAAMRQKVYQLEADLKQAHPDDRKLLANRVKAARNLVYRHQLEAAGAQVVTIAGRLEALAQMRSLEARWMEREKQGKPIPDRAFEQICQARTDIEQGWDAKAKKTLEQLVETLHNCGAVTRGVGDLQDDSQAAQMKLSNAANALAQNAQSLAVASHQPAWLSWLQGTLINLSGLSDLVRAEATYWFVRPLLYSVLLLGLTMVGLNALYIEQGSTFGARPSSDYLGLLLWGLSADVASRSLSGLQEQRE